MRVAPTGERRDESISIARRWLGQFAADKAQQQLAIDRRRRPLVKILRFRHPQFLPGRGIFAWQGIIVAL